MEQPVDDPGRANIPLWALPLFQAVSEIRSLAASIPGIRDELAELRRSTVPMKEHEVLMNRVDQLWDSSRRYQNEIDAYRLMKERVEVLWSDRATQTAMIQSRLRVEARWRWIFGTAITLLALVVAARQTGVHFTI